MGENTEPTLVVDGVPEAEDGEDSGNERRDGRVLTIEEAALDTTRGGSGGCALRQLRVEGDKRREAGALPRALYRRTRERHGTPTEFHTRLTSRVGAATLGGTSPPSWRRTSEAYMVERKKCAGRVGSSASRVWRAQTSRAFRPSCDLYTPLRLFCSHRHADRASRAAHSHSGPVHRIDSKSSWIRSHATRSGTPLHAVTGEMQARALQGRRHR
jgi:hypothetical protein